MDDELRNEFKEIRSHFHVLNLEARAGFAEVRYQVAQVDSKVIRLERELDKVVEELYEIKKTQITMMEFLIDFRREFLAHHHNGPTPQPQPDD